MERLRYEFHLDKLLPEHISVFQIFLSLLLPGASFFVQGRKILGAGFAIAYVLSATVFMVAMGYFAGSIAFGLMMSIHTTSVVFLEEIWLAQERLSLRLIASLCTMVAAWTLLYSPTLQYIENHLLMPLRTGNNVVIVRRTGANAIHRGDWVAYRIPADLSESGRRVVVNSGLGIQQVLALPGDQVSFGPTTFLVNNALKPARSLMPKNGEFVVKEKVWFIWPALDMNVHGGVPEADISAAFQKLAMVPEEEIIGKAFTSWFWRKQRL